MKVQVPDECFSHFLLDMRLQASLLAKEWCSCYLMKRVHLQAYWTKRSTEAAEEQEEREKTMKTLRTQIK